MTDIFDEVIMCRECGKKMVNSEIIKSGYRIRTLECKNCNKRIYHPVDVEEYKKFTILRQRPFSVKLRMVGHSYVVSIPREIIDFQKDMHKEMEKQMERFNKIVKLCLVEPGKVSLMFREKKEDA